MQRLRGRNLLNDDLKALLRIGHNQTPHGESAPSETKPPENR